MSIILDKGKSFFRNLVSPDVTENLDADPPAICPPTPRSATQDNLVEITPFEQMRQPYPVSADVSNLLTDNSTPIYTKHFDFIETSPSIETGGASMHDVDTIEPEKPASFWQSLLTRSGGVFSPALLHQGDEQKSQDDKGVDGHVAQVYSDSGGGNMADSDADYREELTNHFNKISDVSGGVEITDAEIDFGAAIGGKLTAEDDGFHSSKHKSVDEDMPWLMSYCLH